MRCFAKDLGHSSVQFSSVAQSCLTLCNVMHRSTPGFPVHHVFSLVASGFPLSMLSSSIYFFKRNIFICCVRSSLCHVRSLVESSGGCSLVAVCRLLTVGASNCSGFCCGAQALGHSGFSGCSSQAREHRLSSCGAWA